MAVKFGKVENNSDTCNRDIAPAIRMGIEHAPSKLIVKYITDMYQDPLSAAIRETVSNALDAAARLGKGSEAVRAALRPPMSKSDGEYYTLVVRDAGPGMDYDTLVNIYTQYGVSDKRDDSITTGAFGLGAKSPLAYTSEFTVITKSAGSPCMFVRAYRTSDDDFVADLPLEVPVGGVDAISFRNEDGTLSPGVPSPDGAPLCPDGFKESVQHISNPFEDGETGTIVEFPVRGTVRDGTVEPASAHARADTSDAARAARAIAEISDILSGTGESAIVRYKKPVTDKDPGRSYFFLGESEVRDDSGETMPIRIFATSRVSRARGKYDSAIVQRNIVGGVFPARESIAFKVGGWLYPADGTRWDAPTSDTASCKTGLIVDIPSAALPFVPSRDALRLGADTEEVISMILDSARHTVDESLSDPRKAAEYANWVMRSSTFSTFSGRLNALLQLDAGNVVFCSKDSDDNMTIGIRADAESLCVPTRTIDMTWNEAMSSPACVMGNADGLLIARKAVLPVFAGDSIHYWLSPSSKDSLILKGFAVARQKAAADNLTSQPESAVGIKISPKSSAHGADVTEYTIHYPIACAILSVFGAPADHRSYAVASGRKDIETEEPLGRCCVIDASESGIKQARRALPALLSRAVNRQKSSVWIPWTYIFIPPKGKDSAYTPAELEHIKGHVLGLLGDLGVDAVYMSASDLDDALAKPPEEQNESLIADEIHKMIKTGTVLQRRGPTALTIRDNNIPFMERTSQIRDSARKSMAPIIGNANEWAVVIAREYGTEFGMPSVKAARMYAEALIALDEIPDEIQYILCLAERNFTAKRDRALHAAGMNLLYNESVKGSEGRYERGTFSCRVSGNGPDARLLVRSVLPPKAQFVEYCRAYSLRYRRYLVSKAISLGLGDFGGMPHISPETAQDFPLSLCSALSFGYVEVDDTGYSAIIKSGFMKVPRWRRSIFNTLDIVYGDYDSESASEQFDRESRELAESMRQVASLWKIELADTPLRIAYKNLEQSDGARLSQIGEGIGVKDLVELVFRDGIPFSDFIEGIERDEKKHKH